MKNVLVRLQEYRVQANGAEKDLVRYLLEKEVKVEVIEHDAA